MSTWELWINIQKGVYIQVWDFRKLKVVDKMSIEGVALMEDFEVRLQVPEGFERVSSKNIIQLLSEGEYPELYL